MRPEHRERATIEAASRVVNRHTERAKSAAEGYLETIINDTLYHERRRLERASRKDPRAAADLGFYRDVQRKLRHASLRDCSQLLEQIARRFAQEVVGNFDERVYRATTSVIPPALSLLLRAAKPSQLLAPNLKTSLSDHIQLQGAVDHVRGLLSRGTLVVVPTHSSHLDSILLGYAVHLLGMPPLLYGAGLNLFNNPLVSFFMNNLGAYRVDRKKQAVLYKEVLKEFSQVSIELGYNNLFFPGGTRSRSGAVEQHLKRGLLGTALGAYVENLRARRKNPDIFIVPCTISYKLVLEAETLIDDYLQEVGKSRYIIEDDEFSRPRRVLNFLSEIVSLNERVVLTFSQPLDVVGNRVDRDGVSLDPCDRPVDTKDYVLVDGAPAHDHQRDMQYTNDVADQIAQAFMRDNVVMSTHVVSLALFRLLQQNNAGMDLYRLLHSGGLTPSFPVAEVASYSDQILNALSERSTGPLLGQELKQLNAREIVDDALRHYATYHKRPAAVRRGDRIFHEDRKLLYYYSNRLRGYDLGRKLESRQLSNAGPA